MTVVTVSELNQKIKALFESHFSRVFVEGEISAVTLHTSGHLYFTIKDESSSIRCVMFKSNVSRLKFRPEVGMSVVVEGGLSVYAPKGEYQLLCASIEPSGHGALALALQQLKKKLSAKGYFDESNKKKLPKIPRNIALVTSKTGAVLQDMLRVAEKRWPLVKLTLLNTLVQGDTAAAQIASAVRYADSLGSFDIIVVARGGGSVEDLWCFNEEVVADAIYEAKTPVVSAVGHEVDYSISDFVADLRAPTPSACMELILPDINDTRMALDSMQEQMRTSAQRLIYNGEIVTQHLSELLKARSPSTKIAFAIEQAKTLRPKLNELLRSQLLQKEQILINLQETLKRQLQYTIQQKSAQLDSLSVVFAATDSHRKNLQTFAMVVKNGKKVALESCNVGETVELQSAQTVATAKIESIRAL